MKLKLVCLIISSLLLNTSFAMMRRAQTTRARTGGNAPRRSIAFVLPETPIHFKVVPPIYLQESVTRATTKMNGSDKYKCIALNTSLVTHYFNGNLINAHRLLKSKDDAERSIILDQVDERDGRSLLLKAAHIGALNFMDFLLHHGANAAITDKHGATPLTINALRLTPALVDKLVANGAWCMEEDQFKRNVLHYLAMRANGKKLYTVSPAGEDYSVYEETNGKVARKVIPEGANMYRLDVYGKTPIDIALETDHLKVLKAFIDSGANIETILAQASPKILMDLEQYCQKY